MMVGMKKKGKERERERERERGAGGCGKGPGNPAERHTSRERWAGRWRR